MRRRTARPVRRTGRLSVAAGSSTTRVASALASRSPIAYLVVRCAKPRVTSTALALGGHTTRLARRAARLTAARLHSSYGAEEVLCRLVWLAESPRLLANIYAALDDQGHRAFATTLRRHPGSDAELLELLRALPANVAADLVMSVRQTQPGSRILLAARYGDTAPLEAAVCTLAAAYCFHRDVAFSVVLDRLDRLAAQDPSGAWAVLLASELTGLSDTPSAALAARVACVEASLEQLGPLLGIAARTRAAGSPATLDELAVLVALDDVTGYDTPSFSPTAR